MRGTVRVIALLAAYNEERFIGTCIEHLIRQGVQVYLLDNESTDRTVEIAKQFLGKGLLAIEPMPRADVYSWQPILQRKEQLAATLDGDWFMHVDADEIRLPPRSDQTLAQAFSEVQAQGYNAVNFIEFSFIPTRDAPDHDHPDFQKTMRWYYPFLPRFPNRLNAWRQQRRPVELAWSGGHKVRFPGLRMYPISFPMRHYLFLSVRHAIEKYVERVYDPSEVQRGWHGWRPYVTPEMVMLPSSSELRVYTSDDDLDASHPHLQHYVAQFVTIGPKGE